MNKLYTREDIVTFLNSLPSEAYRRTATEESTQLRLLTGQPLDPGKPDDPMTWLVLKGRDQAGPTKKVLYRAVSQEGHLTVGAALSVVQAKAEKLTGRTVKEMHLVNEEPLSFADGIRLLSMLQLAAMRGWLTGTTDVLSTVPSVWYLGEGGDC